MRAAVTLLLGGAPGSIGGPVVEGFLEEPLHAYGRGGGDCTSAGLFAGVPERAAAAPVFTQPPQVPVMARLTEQPLPHGAPRQRRIPCTSPRLADTDPEYVRLNVVVGFQASSKSKPHL